MMSGDEFYDDDVTSGPIHRWEQTGADPDGLHAPTPCTATGHVDGCAGKAGGEHELKPGWIAYEEDGFLMEVEVTHA